METEQISRAFEPGARLLSSIVDMAPTAGVALLVLLLGLAVTAAARWLTRSVVQRTGLEALAERAGVARLLYAIGIKRGIGVVLGNVVGAVGALVTLATVAEIVGLPGVAEGVGVVVDFVPDVVAAGALTLFGFLAADFLSRLVERMGSGRSDLMAPRFAAAVIYYAVLVVVLTMALQHLGLQTDLLARLIQIAAAAALFSLGMALALAGRGLLGNLLSRHYARRVFDAGDRVAVDGVEGVIVGWDTVSVVLRTGDGELVLPCSKLLDGPVKVTRAADLVP